MTIEIAIAASAIIGLCIGLYANRKGIKERDERIAELKHEITVKQNAVESQNATIGRLRKIAKKKGYDAGVEDN